MKSVGIIQKPGGAYPVVEIEQTDVNAIKPYCGGFIHGGKKDGLENIIRSNMLLCSDALRQPTDPKTDAVRRVRDNSTQYPPGRAVYFRYAPKGIPIQKIPKHVTGPGSTGGLIFFVPLDKVVGKSVICFCEHDTQADKFSRTTEIVKGKAVAKPDDLITRAFANTAIEAKKMLDGGANNSSEIGFHDRVSLDIVKWLLVDKKTGKGIDTERNRKWVKYSKIVYKSCEYDVYRNVDNFPMPTAAPADPSDSSASSSSSSSASSASSASAAPTSE